MNRPRAGGIGTTGGTPGPIGRPGRGLSSVVEPLPHRLPSRSGQASRATRAVARQHRDVAHRDDAHGVGKVGAGGHRARAGRPHAGTRHGRPLGASGRMDGSGGPVRRARGSVLRRVPHPDGATAARRRGTPVDRGQRPGRDGQDLPARGMGPHAGSGRHRVDLVRGRRRSVLDTAARPAGRPRRVAAVRQRAPHGSRRGGDGPGAAAGGRRGGGRMRPGADAGARRLRRPRLPRGADTGVP